MKVEDDDIVHAWADYSDAVCASWLMLPEDDDALLKILLQHLPTSRVTWQTTVLDAGDGCGECVLELPEDLLVRTGWKEGDTLIITQAESGGWILERVE